ncbi:AMP-forming long-chain acyl-CoA synthetase [Halovivax ruber XH-70]|uniref:AMP-forming long-chain acyl-CoA synthetase n=1 Tax=Halovivax ruber (strain DSM 18193 / JCM 13892 / XH-70) TaxID=797302 RepID=L0IDJ8_HALRX|nr:long-chain fatty acid--CoA ligase [Halovivax ruber]AGB17640.1 AMP-forming long-chain acyl-CoA synthetase [Halovivax ruber XH-70]
MDLLATERDYEDEVTGETTLGRLFEDAAERYPDRPAQLYKGGIYDRTITGSILPQAPPGEWETITYGEMRDVVRKLAAGFRELGIDGGDRVGIFANTRMEWAQTDFSLLSIGAVVSTVYAGSSTSKVSYLLGDAGADAVVVENGEMLDRVLEVEDELDLSFIVTMDTVDEATARDDVYTLAEVYDIGSDVFDPEAYREWLDEPDMDDLASLIYTSGTTGKPKGVQLTHRNFRANVTQVRKRVARKPETPDDVPSIDEHTRVVSYLPLAHVFERTSGHFLMFGSGASVAYAESPDTLQDDFAAVEPTSATSVPRVYEKIYDAIREQASESAIKEKIFEWAVDVGVEYQETDSPGPILDVKRKLADKLVFSTVRDALGGNIEMLISGGGSLSAELCSLYHAMGLPIYEGYGLTETAPVVSVNPPGFPKVGTIGPPVVDIQTTVDESIVDDDAFASDPGEVGELVVRGPNVSEGYWNKPGATERSYIDEAPGEVHGELETPERAGQWFRTGDIVHRRPDGYIEFRERAKQILVLSTGKNVAPGPIEDRFAASSVVEQCMVVGDGRKFVSALVVPNMEHVREWAAEEGIDLPDDPEAACTHDRVREYVRDEVDRVNEHFEDYETIKKFRLVGTEFTEENDLMTPTMKKKRRTITDRFEDRIESMYPED